MKAKNLATVAFSVIFLVSFAVNGYLFFSVNTDLQSQVERFQNQVNSLEKQIVNLENQSSSLSKQIGILQAENSVLQSEKANLQTQVANLTDQLTPNLITSLGVKDMNIPPMLHIAQPNYRLFIQGTVNNTGGNPAYNSSLHVTLYRGEAIVEDTYISLGTIYGHASVPVETNIPYTGDPLTSWTIIPTHQTQP